MASLRLQDLPKNYLGMHRHGFFTEDFTEELVWFGADVRPFGIRALYTTVKDS